jgi:hypothetical protein
MKKLQLAASSDEEDNLDPGSGGGAKPDINTIEEYKGLNSASWKKHPIEVSDQEDEDFDDEMPIQEGTGSQGSKTMEMMGNGSGK